MRNPGSGLRFDILERIHLPESAQPVHEWEEVELAPRIELTEQDDQVVLKGHLLLSGVYLGEHRNESRLEHKIPVEISLPGNRIGRLEEIAVEIDNFDVDTVSPRGLNVTGVLTLHGVEFKQPSEAYFVHQPQMEESESGSPAAEIQAAQSEESQTAQSEAVHGAETEEVQTAQAGEVQAERADEDGNATAQQPALDWARSAREAADRKARNEPAAGEAANESANEAAANEAEKKKPAGNEAAEAAEAANVEAEKQEANVSANQSSNQAEEASDNAPNSEQNSMSTAEANGNEIEETDREEHSIDTGADEETESPDEAGVKIAFSSIKKTDNVVSESDAEAGNERDPAEADINSESEAISSGVLKNLFLSTESESEEEHFSKMRMCIVQKEDTIDSIAARYELNPRELLLVNRLGDNQSVFQGQVLYIPG